MRKIDNHPQFFLHPKKREGGAAPARRPLPTAAAGWVVANLPAVGLVTRTKSLKLFRALILGGGRAFPATE